MFKGLTKDLAGTADICNTVTDLRKVDANAYLLPGEQVLFAFQSAKEEFAFTNEALITVKGENATTTRKLVTRYGYREYQVSRVEFETTGRVDRDCEIKFRLGEHEEVSIDIAKKEEQAVKKYYKVLVALQREQQDRRRGMGFSRLAMERSAETLRLDGLHVSSAPSTSSSSENMGPLTSEASRVLQYLQQDFEQKNPRCYRATITAALG
jgi:hypothetical protein